MALGKYEVVVLFDAANSQDKINDAKKTVEKLIEKFGGRVIEKDDIGYLETLYEIGSSNNPYFYSLYTELKTDTIKDLKKQLGVLPAIIRYKIFKMKPNQKFLKLKDIEKEIEVIDFTKLTKSGIFNEINQSVKSTK